MVQEHTPFAKLLKQAHNLVITGSKDNILYAMSTLNPNKHLVSPIE